VKLGLEYCVYNGLVPLTKETNSLITNKILDGVWEISWVVYVDVRNIKELLSKVNVEIEHIHIEENKLAYFLSNNATHFASKDTNTRTYNQAHELPHQAQAINQLEKSKMPNL